ncbi:hypothetical protein [Microvirga calopogonii]|uniref:hypothetical protein n=1 Tax=Microvirga calopogonii TaxID=2078013 RepID=UPI000E0D1BB0
MPLRDGEHPPDVSFTTAEKLEMAGSLPTAGVTEIDTGRAMDADETEAIRAAFHRWTHRR